MPSSECPNGHSARQYFGLSTALNPRRAQDFRNLRAEYARSALDRPNRLTVAALYDVPFFKHSNWYLKNLVGNLEIDPVYTFQSPQPVTPQSSVDSNLNGDSAGDAPSLIQPGTRV